MKEAFLKLASYCAYQERCESEVRQKLMDLGVRDMEMEQVMVELREESFLNEARVCRALCRGQVPSERVGEAENYAGTYAEKNTQNTHLSSHRSD